MKKLNNKIIFKLIKLMIISFFLFISLLLINKNNFNNLLVIPSTEVDQKDEDSSDKSKNIHELITKWLSDLTKETKKELFSKTPDNDTDVEAFNNTVAKKIKDFFESVLDWDLSFIANQATEYKKVEDKTVIENQLKTDGTSAVFEENDNRRKSVELLNFIKDQKLTIDIKENLFQIHEVIKHEEFNNDLIKLLFKLNSNNKDGSGFELKIDLSGADKWDEKLELVINQSKLNEKYASNLKDWFDNKENSNKNYKKIKWAIQYLKKIDSNLPTSLIKFENLSLINDESTDLLNVFNIYGSIDEIKLKNTYRIENLMKIKEWFSEKSKLNYLYMILIKYELGQFETTEKKEIFSFFKKLKLITENSTDFFINKYLGISLKSELIKPLEFVESFTELMNNFNNDGYVKDDFLKNKTEKDPKKTLIKLFLFFDWIIFHYETFNEKVDLQILRKEFEKLEKDKKDIVKKIIEKKYRIIKKYKWKEIFNDDDGSFLKSKKEEIKNNKNSINKYIKDYKKITFEKFEQEEKEEQKNLIRTISLSTTGSLLGFLLITYFLFKNKYIKKIFKKIIIKK